MTTTGSGRPLALPCRTDVQKLIAKYGLAAHLALLAVAPLFLFPFFGNAVVCAVVLWLSLLSVIWMLLAPSVLRQEHLQDARWRMSAAVVHDPLCWVLVAIVAAAAARALNTGVSLAYDAEISAWSVSPAYFPILPGSVGEEGVLPFVAVLASSIIIMSCRHALGRSARLAFLVVATALAGAAGLVSHLAVSKGVPGVIAYVEFPVGLFSFSGFAYGVYLLASMVALFAVLENGWNAVLLLPVVAIGGNAAACYSFSPAYLSVAFLGMAVILFFYSAFCTGKVLPLSCKIRFLFVGIAAVFLGALLVAAVLPAKTLEARLAPCLGLSLFPESFWEVRRVVSAMALKSWMSHLWAGTGVGSFSLDFRFCATAENWTMMPRGIASAPNGWWQLLAERGLVGCVSFVLPVGFLVVSYVCRLVGNVRDWSLPHPACLLTPVLLMLLGAAGFVDCSLMRPEVLMICGALLSISALSFPKKRVEKHG